MFKNFDFKNFQTQISFFFFSRKLFRLIWKCPSFSSNVFYQMFTFQTQSFFYFRKLFEKMSKLLFFLVVPADQKLPRF